MNLSPSSVIEPEPIPARSPLSIELDAREKVYDPQLCLLGCSGSDIGYHTRMTSKDWVHPIRENFMYAVDLLTEGSPARVQRAFKVLDGLLDLQDTREESKTYGIWSWFFEEPLEKMNPPDWNWAGFCGMQISIALVKFPALLPAVLKARMKSSLGHCSRSIIRRDIKPHYTNIAYLSALVTLVAGDVLDQPDFTIYGRNLLAQIEESLHFHGNYNEYNSPTYTLLLIQFCDCILQTARDKQALVLAEKLRNRTWEIISDYFHPVTAQWAGPQSRSYGIWLDENTVREISERVGFDLPSRSKKSGGPSSGSDVIKRLPCPPAIAKRFQRLPKDDYELNQIFIRKDTEEQSIRGRTWFSNEACLGSVNQESCWNQRRVVLGYWKTEQDLAVQLRLRFLHDGRDFVSAWSNNSQSGRRVLTAISFLVDNGDFHPVFYFPDNSEFQAEDFRVRYELLGKGVSGVKTADGRFELRAGSIRALLQPMDGTFHGREITWKLNEIEGGIALDGICYAGPRQTFPFKELGHSYLTIGLELLTDKEPNPACLPSVNRVAGADSSVAWGPAHSPLKVAFSSLPHRQP